MKLVRRIKEALTTIGFSNLVALIRYTGERDRLERRFPSPEPMPWEDGWADRGWTGPGKALEAARISRGLRVRFERAELSLAFLAPDLLEVTWREPPSWLPLPERDWPAVAVTVEEKPGERAGGLGGWVVRSADLEVRLAPDGSLTLAEAGRILREEQPPLFAGDSVRHLVRLAPGERLHGLGERAAPLDLRGGLYRMWNRDPSVGYGPGEDPIYLCLPVYLSRGGSRGDPGYLAFYANPHPGLFDMGRTDSGVLEHRFTGGGLRYYLVPGPAARAVERYTDLTGKPPLPPLWALGYHQCRWSYYPEERVRRLAADFERHQVPIDSIHLDIHYMDGYRVFTVDERRFPDLGRLAEDLGRQGLRLVTIIDPGVKKDPGYYLYREGLERRAFVTLPEEATRAGGLAVSSDIAGYEARLAIAPVWPGPCAFPDFSVPKVREWWGSQYRRLLDAGVAGFWHDMNEPAAFVSAGQPTLPLPARHAVGDHRAVHNIYGLLMDQAGYEGLRLLDPERRPFLVSRSGWAGVQRYAWVWNADVRSDWDCLRQTLVTMLGLGLSGVPFVGSDVGGFVGTPTPELYIRWLQMSAFMPFFRSHTMVASPDQEPWSYGEPYTTIARETIRLRYALMPYIYTVAWEAAEKGRPVVRPLFWAGGEDSEDAFLVGDALLAAPVLEEGATSREIPVPPGLWYDYWTDRPFQGPTRIRLDAPLARLPLLVRAGTVLPAAVPASGPARRVSTTITLHVYPPAAGDEGLADLYTDSGDGYGPGRLDRFRLRRDSSRLELLWEEAGSGGGGRGYPWPYREVVLVLHGATLRGVEVDGQKVSVTGGRCTTERFARATFTLEPAG